MPFRCMKHLFRRYLRALGKAVGTGEFGAMMEVGLVNDGTGDDLDRYKKTVNDRRRFFRN